MRKPGPGQEERPLTVFTDDYRIEGALLTSTMVRTLDDLNNDSTFFTLNRVEPTADAPELREGPLSVNKEAILFVLEREERPALQSRGRFALSAIDLRLGEHRVEGLLHVPPGGQPKPLLDARTPRFIAITRAKVTGPGIEVEASFLAVRRGAIQFVQVLGPDATAAAETEPAR
ncbi:MAG TPA: hypothetical protein VMT16_11680 [Thermoanaerobaculia bacterium]|nr:hypothetical protein [Thermoanaerobaculia bacterium]